MDMAEALSLRVRWGHTKSYKLQNFMGNQTVQQTIDEVAARCELEEQEYYCLFSPSGSNSRWLEPSMTLSQAGLNARVSSFPSEPSRALTLL